MWAIRLEGMLGQICRALNARRRARLAPEVFQQGGVHADSSSEGSLWPHGSPSSSEQPCEVWDVIPAFTETETKASPRGTKVSTVTELRGIVRAELQTRWPGQFFHL